MNEEEGRLESLAEHQLRQASLVLDKIQQDRVAKRVREDVERLIDAALAVIDVQWEILEGDGPPNDTVVERAAELVEEVELAHKRITQRYT